MQLPVSISPTTLWSLTAAVPVMITEYMFRTQQTDWLHNLHYYLPMQLMVSYCVYRLITEPGVSLIEAFVVWAITTTVTRVILSYFILGDVITPGTWFAVALIIMAKVAQNFWR